MIKAEMKEFYLTERRGVNLATSALIRSVRTRWYTVIPSSSVTEDESDTIKESFFLFFLTVDFGRRVGFFASEMNSNMATWTLSNYEEN